MSDRVDIGVQHRLIGAEDVDWDSQCTNETTEFVTPFGVTKPLSKINAGHIPLDNATKLALEGAQTVAAALQVLKRNSGQSTPGGGSSGMAEDTTVAISSSVSSVSLINGLIEDQGKDLGGNTLTFQFASNSNRSFNGSLDFSGFRNGKVVVDLNGNSMTMSVNLANGIFHFSECQAVVEVCNGTIVFTSKGTSPAIKAENCLAVHCSEVSFTNDQSSTTSYAVFGLATDCRFTSCTVANGLFYNGGTKSNGNWLDANGAWIQSNKLSEDVEDGIERLNSLAETWDTNLSASAVVSHGYDETTGAHWREYSDGLLVQWGTADVGVYNVTVSNNNRYNYYYAAKVRFAATPRKRYKDNGYLAFIEPSCDVPIEPVYGEDTSLQEFTFTSSSLVYDIPAFIRLGTNCVIPSGKDIDRFVVVNLNAQTTSSSIDAPSVPNDAKYNWLTIGTVHDSDKATSNS